MKNIVTKELVCPHIYAKYGDKSIKFFRHELLETLDVVRNEIICAPLIINNKTYTQRGLRCNICELCASKTKAGKLYMSAHSLAAGVDFSSPKYTANQMRDMIIKNQDKLPYKIRLESPLDAPTWVHMDVLCEADQKDKIYVFRA